MTALLIDALCELGGLTITVRHELEPASQRLMDTLGVTVVIDERAPACSRHHLHEGNRSSCTRCTAIEKKRAA